MKKKEMTTTELINELSRRGVGVQYPLNDTIETSGKETMEDVKFAALYAHRAERSQRELLEMLSDVSLDNIIEELESRGLYVESHGLEGPISINAESDKSNEGLHPLTSQLIKEYIDRNPLTGKLVKEYIDRNPWDYSSESAEQDSNETSHGLRVGWLAADEESAEQVNQRAEILRTAEKLINGDRAQTYGDPEISFGRIADLWNAMGFYIYEVDTETGFNRQLNAVDVALALIQLKVSRTISSTGHEDNWVDIAGYAGLGGEMAMRRNKTDE